MKFTGPKKYLHRYQIGEKITIKQTLKAKCCECMGDFADGKVDCLIPECPIYPYQPYQKSVLRPKRCSKTHTPEERKALGARLHRPKVESVAKNAYLKGNSPQSSSF